MKKIIKKTGIYFLIFISMISIFSFGIIISYLIPNNRIRDNIRESMDYINYTSKDNDPIFRKYIKTMKLDAYSDILILNTSINKGKSEDENVLIRAFENSRYSENDDQVLSIEKVVYDDELYNNEEYSRYWHGIQTILRPLLIAFNYEEIKALFMIIMFILFGITIIYIYKNLGVLHALAFLLTMTAIGFFMISISLQYIGIFAITLIAIILINIIYDKKKEYLYPYLFFIIGGCATYFDLLTVPLITLGIPLEIMVLLKCKNNKDIKLKDIIWEIFKISILWSVSYAAAFMMKWVIASIVLHKDAITVAINQILFRMNGNEQYPATSIGAVKINISFLNNKIFIFIMIVISLIWLITVIKHRKKIKDLKIITILFLLSLYPYIWYMIFKGHSTIHTWFTYRLQSISIFGILCIMIEMLDSKKLRE